MNGGPHGFFGWGKVPLKDRFEKWIPTSAYKGRCQVDDNFQDEGWIV